MSQRALLGRAADEHIDRAAHAGVDVDDKNLSPSSPVNTATPALVGMSAFTCTGMTVWLSEQMDIYQFVGGTATRSP